MMDSNLNPAKPFHIHIMRHWNGWDVVNDLNQSKVTQSWCHEWNTGQANFEPNHDPNHVEVISLEPIYQPQPSPTIHHTYNETLEWLGCSEWSESVQSHSILV